MLTISQRLGSLAAKYRGATRRTAKDGEEYSQLIFEVENVEVTDTEVNAVFSNPNAYRAIKALYAAVPGIKSIEVETKIEGAFVGVRLAAVSAANGSEFAFNGSTIDKLKFSHLASEALSCDFRVTTKPALNAQFGELISRMGHTAMFAVNAVSPNAQASLPLANGHDDSPPATLADALKADARCTHGILMDDDCPKCLAEQQPIGSADEEKLKARSREQMIAAEIERDRGTAMDAAIADGKSTQELLASKPKRKRSAARATAH